MSILEITSEAKMAIIKAKVSLVPFTPHDIFKALYINTIDQTRIGIVKIINTINEVELSTIIGFFITSFISGILVKKPAKPRIKNVDKTKVF